MIFKTLEFIPRDITSTIESLQLDINNGKYDDILINYCFLTFTEKGLTLVKQDKTIVTNAIVDLSSYSTTKYNDDNYVKKLSGYSLIKDSEIERLSNVTNYDDTTIKQDIEACALKTDIPDVSNFITEIPSEYITEDELNSKGYLTEHQSLENYAQLSDIPDISNLISSEFINNMFKFDDNGNLLVTINGITQTYAPMTTE